MEFEVRVVGGIESCFASLPLSLIHTLQSTSISGSLPPLLPLELRSIRNHDKLWHVSWSGCASSSSAIEIAQLYAECIELLDRTVVQVKVTPNVPKATLVTIEPHTEDDWEILELNSEHAEEAILKQVGIVHEAMRFPLWLHGQTSVTFLVVSTLPKNPVVQLVPKTEVAVAPKRRKRNSDSHKDSSIPTSESRHPETKALLRVQDLDKKYVSRHNVHGVEMEVSLTSAVFLHPETASRYSFNSLQLLLMVRRPLSKENKSNDGKDNLRMRGSRMEKEANNGNSIDKQEHSQAVVRLLISESVAKGHVMLSQPLRFYLRAGLHSWVYVKTWSGNLKQDIPFIKLSPCQLEKLHEDEAFENDGTDVLVGQKNFKANQMLFRTNSGAEMGMIDWSIHERIIAALCNKSPGDEDQKDGTESGIKKGLLTFLQAWCQAQCDAIISNSGLQVSSLMLGSKTLVHFTVEGKFFDQPGKLQGPKVGLFKRQHKAGERSADILFILSITDESMHAKKMDAYEISFDHRKENGEDKSLESLLPKLHLSDGVCIYAVNEQVSDKNSGLAISSLNWMGTAASDVINRLTALLSRNSVLMLSNYELPLPGHVLIYGPPGSGKTLLATVAAKSVQDNVEILAHVVNVCCSRLTSEKHSNIRQALSGYISEALDHAPSVVIFDDLDSLISSSPNPEVQQQSLYSVGLTQFLLDIMDEYEEKQGRMCGIGPIAFIATAQSLTNVPQTLSSSGRFDCHVKLPAPAAAERAALLKHEFQKRHLECHDDVISDIASKCDGYDAYDIEILVDRSVHTAVGRFLSSDLGSKEQVKPTLVRDDFLHAMHEFLPVALRDLTKPPSEGRHSGWEDIGGLDDIRNSIKEMIELPSEFPNIFAQAPLRMRTNVLLYGPPGCGKTHIVGAAAAACSLRFISVKGPELLNKYIGASEQAVRDIFSKAAAAAPCLLFFDEFDSIAPKRGHDNTGVTDRVVNQFLTELDGVEVLTGVFVFAATSRPDLLDAALLRPGRLDRLLFCDFPSEHERLDILRVLSRKLPLAGDVDLGFVARMTEGFSGADLQALLSDAQLEAVHDLLGNEDDKRSKKMPIISDTLLKSIASKAKPSVSESEKRRLYDIYRQFLDSKRSIAAQSRDAKGKRATLA
ncbi:peroxisome biogenesis protein 1 [Coffea eugenioides]|uniref:peroxisome biogenesis protein 1 n=1 Tax=Coffea eugenioides TaxID=49369 RepID=UPI000F612FD6|nr:peroxisome biogenesis protein 1 [Coffea eugenioides]